MHANNFNSQPSPAVLGCLLFLHGARHDVGVMPKGQQHCYLFLKDYGWIARRGGTPE